MKKFAIAGFAAGLVAVAALLVAQEAPKAPKMPEPQKEHAWLQQLVGQWQADVEAFMEPGKPAEKSQGTESVRALGGFWVVADFKGTAMGQPFAGVFTLGYDPAKAKYIGSWVDSMGSHLWTFEGAVDAAGKTLTLEAVGPCPMKPGEMVKFKEVMEIKSKDHRIFTSSMQGEDGKWTTGMIINYRRQ